MIKGIYKSIKAENAKKRPDILPSGISMDDFSYKQLRDYADGMKESLATQSDKFTKETKSSTEKELNAVLEEINRRARAGDTGFKKDLFNALKNHKKTPGYNYSDFDEKDIDDFLEVTKTDMPNASPDELTNELISRYENAAKLTAK